MRLNFEKLKSQQKGPGTPGTPGTASVHAGSSVPAGFGSPGTPGTDESRGGSFVPAVPGHQNAPGTETASVYAPVPVVPGVPGENSVSRLQDHTFWSDDFGRWALSECLFSDRCHGGVKVLHQHFCDWCVAQQTVGCMLETFEALLEDEGFAVTNKHPVCPDGLVRGLILKEGLATALFEPPCPSGSERTTADRSGLV